MLIRKVGGRFPKPQPVVRLVVNLMWECPRGSASIILDTVVISKRLILCSRGSTGCGYPLAGVRV